MLSEMNLTLSGGNLAIKMSGNSGKRILALHGWLDNAASFDDLGPRITNTQFVAADWPGHGLSSHKGPGFPYHMIDYVGVILSILEELRWKSCVLLGHSLGGSAACLFAGAFPERVEKLILLESAGPFSSEAEGLPDRVRKAYTELVIPAKKKNPVYPTIEEALAVRMKGFAANPVLLRKIVERGLMPVKGGFSWRSDPRLKHESPQRLTEEQVLSHLRRITCPTLLITGKDGIKVPGSFYEIRKQSIQKFKEAEVLGQHYPHMDSPEEAARLINEFIASA